MVCDPNEDFLNGSYYHDEYSQTIIELPIRGSWGCQIIQ